VSKTAILQVADQGPLESLVVMLRSVGYECFLPSQSLRDELKRLCGRDGYVVSPTYLTHAMGYDRPMSLPEAGVADVADCALFVDVKAHRCYPHLVRAWSNLAGKVLWYRINGGRPEHVVKPDGEDCGDEADPPCPVLTPNQWYKDKWFGIPSDDPPDFCGADGRAYACWPPFYRFDEYARAEPISDTPVCLVHNLAGWGYGALVEPLRALGVRMYGAGSPDGLVQHGAVPKLLSSALAMVHLKSNDAPGYSILECLAAACPLVCTRRLIWRCRMNDLLVPGETCLVFDRETHDPLSEADVAECTREVREHLTRLADPEENRRVGEAGRQRLAEVMWSERKPEDVESLRAFMEKHFGG
jgi:hypothetical protein